MKLIPHESGFLYVVQEQRSDIKTERLYFEKEGTWKISFNGGRAFPYKEGMSIPVNYHKVPYLNIKVFNGNEVYQGDPMQVTTVTIIGKPEDALYPKAIGALNLTVEELLDRVETLENKMAEVYDQGDII